MHVENATPDQILDTALSVISSPRPGAYEVLDHLPAPIYVTDAEGRVTYFNQACIGFAGRMPSLGEDRWCVTWKLYTQEGAFLPHDQCPMAVAIREKRDIRGAEAIAERPDGSRVTFRPYPTPILNDAGDLVGAVNLLVDVTDLKQVEHLRSQAMRCLRLAASIGDRQTAQTLKHMAAEYEEQAGRLQRPH
nr:PAS domain-containing protein [uncultured Sphingosinicella sp.]